MVLVLGLFQTESKEQNKHKVNPKWPSLVQLAWPATSNHIIADYVENAEGSPVGYI